MATTPNRPYGTVESHNGVNVRNCPSTYSSVLRTLGNGEHVGLQCKVRTQNIDGNDIWYLLRERGGGWVTARYVANTGNVNWCGDTATGDVAADGDSAG
ncbi:SH3 domain-containing protein [Streptomyces lavendulae]|uniref:SH3 domain-containing protein n=1 Tax=Streptomyces lavendulae TaxID=1914 RepID=UPI0036CDBB05